MLPCWSTPPASRSGRRSLICSFQHLKGLESAAISGVVDSVVIVLDTVGKNDDDDDDDDDDDGDS